jgi:deoxycytidylate deaminase
MNLLDKYYPQFVSKAGSSDVNYQLAAGILQDKKLVCKPCCNQNRCYYRGYHCNSIHAEANAILQYFGKSLRFCRGKNRWYLLQHRKCKKKEK